MKFLSVGMCLPFRIKLLPELFCPSPPSGSNFLARTLNYIFKRIYQNCLELLYFTFPNIYHLPITRGQEVSLVYFCVPDILVVKEPFLI